MIRRICERDYPDVAEIYNHYIRNTTITFEEEEVEVNEIGKRIEKVLKTYEWLVAEKDETVVGYAYAEQYMTRSAYRHTMITSVYLRPDSLSQGFGSRLYKGLFERLSHTLFLRICFKSGY
jgi:L-amino acid N-acyltransferase YncA